MMTSLGGDKARGPRDKALPASTHITQPQKQLQATAEQIRLAQMIYDKNDADFEGKVNQLMEVTGKNQDECMVALHDCNEDVNRAINFLLESTSDTTSWETVGKKKPLVKDGPSEGKENKENREKRAEREGSRGRGGANRRGKGASRNRQGRPEENGVEVAPVERVESSAERGRRGRGRGECIGCPFGSSGPVHALFGQGSGGRGRGRGPPVSRFSAQGMGTFNPADYTSERSTGTTQGEAWETGANNNSTDGTGVGATRVAWRSTMDDWAAEDWSEDVSFSETKVFTSSCAPAAENHITTRQSVDLATLLQKPVGVRGEEGGIKAPSAQNLVFTNSHHHHTPAQTRNGTGMSTGTTSYAHAALSSVLGAGFGDLGQSKRSQSSPGAQILEQLKGPGLGPLPSSQAPPPSTQLGSPLGRLPGLGAHGAPPSTSSWDIKGSEPSASQFSREFALQPEPSLVLSQLRHSGPPLPLACQPQPPTSSAPSQQTAASAEVSAATTSPAQEGPLLTASGGSKTAPSVGPDPQGSNTPQQQRAQLKVQKRRIPPSSKIPSSAVEMPGSADVPGLNLQFGALDFGSESALPDFGSADNCGGVGSRESPPVPAPAPQNQSSLYSKPHSESLVGPLSSSEPIYPSPSVSMPSLAPSLLGTASSVAPHSSSSSTPSSVPSSSPFVSAGSDYDCGVAPHSRLAFSQSKENPGPVMNGLNGVRSTAALDKHGSATFTVRSVALSLPAPSVASTPKSESPASLSLSTSSAPPAHMPPSHSAALSSLATDMTSASLAQLNSHVSSSHSSVSALGSSSLTYTSVDSNVSSLAPLSGSSFSSAPPPSAHLVNSSISQLGHMSSMMSGAGGVHAALGLGPNGTSSNLNTPRTAPLLSSSTGKAPPNLSQGVPPLLPNQYIMGPGGLLPAYPQIYGYEDLHMLQSRLPMPSLQDYYGITFPGPTALSGRDGSLANNPYSGEVTKFGRGDSTSPAPPTSLSAPQPPQGQNQGQSQPQPPQPQGQPQGQHHSSQQAFLPPGYSYTGLPYYAGMPSAVPSAAFQYAPTMFVPPGSQGPSSAKQHGMGLGLGNPSASPFQQQQQQQQASSYGQHTFSSGYEDLTQGPAGGDYSKGYSNSSQTQAKSTATGPGKGVSVTSSNSGVPDISGTVYNKTQSFDKQGFHAGTPPPFNLPSALGGPGPLNPGGAPGGYAPAPFLHILPAHQQQHSQLLHHHLAQDGQGGPSQRGQSSSMQQKSQVNKSSYGSSPYWAN
ncbi:ubiquitin-associated protein 2a isoform X5 [Osmerus eperlanus]|uniref:ubiquitin-associated protein 2a isoform X5 n=1 Tax=Osmerus eperlanus TaxID=29151 RepID=UPI002E139C86